MDSRFQNKQVYSMVYEAGSRPGRNRYIYVLDNNLEGVHVYAYDFEEQGFRRFIPHEISAVSAKPLKWFKVDVSSLPKSFNDADKLVRAYNVEGKWAFYDKNDGVIVVAEKPVKEIEEVRRNGNNYVAIRHKGREILLNSDGVWGPKYSHLEPTFDNLMKIMKEIE